MNFMTNFGLSKLHIGLNISMKLNRTLIDASVIFYSVHGPFEASFYEITLGRRPLVKKK